MPPSRGQGAGEGQPRKRTAPAIRDAAASAAGSAGTTPAPGSKPAATPLSSTSASGGGRAARKPSPRRRPIASRRVEASSPRFPDYEAPAQRVDPWGQPDPAAGDRRDDIDPQRTLGDWFEAVIPPEAQVHFIRAGQEFAAGVQTTVEHHLGRGSGAAAGPDRASRIEIE